jgi:hypothetical protein
MSALTKAAGLLAGVSAVAVIGVAVAQSEPPNPLIPHHAIAAGQQSSHITPMGETGVLAPLGEIRTATITREPEVAVVAPPPAPVAQPAPEPVAAAPAPEPAPSTTVAMGAAPEPMQPEPAPLRPRQDRN